MQDKPIFPTERDHPYSRLRRAADAILNLVYPENCLVCSAPVSRWQDCGVCDECWQKTLKLRISRPWCPSCGMPFQHSETGCTHLCGDCMLRTPPFTGARSFGFYSAELSRIIQAFKFRGRKNLTGLLAPLMASAFTESWSRADMDLVVPVPLHRKRKLERGYNQAGLLGRSLARLIGLPYSQETLERVRHTPPQVGFTSKERLKNLRRAFRCSRPADVRRRRLLLVDDVMTTGATLASASETLLEAGALRVSALTLARTVTRFE